MVVLDLILVTLEVMELLVLVAVAVVVQVIPFQVLSMVGMEVVAS